VSLPFSCRRLTFGRLTNRNFATSLMVMFASARGGQTAPVTVASAAEGRGYAAARPARLKRNRGLLGLRCFH